MFLFVKNKQGSDAWKSMYVSKLHKEAEKLPHYQVNGYYTEFKKG